VRTRAGRRPGRAVVAGPHALGGYLGEGINTVGERGMEYAIKNGSQVEIIPQGGVWPSAPSGGPTYVHVDVHVAGSVWTLGDLTRAVRAEMLRAGARWAPSERGPTSVDDCVPPPERVDE
jgi:hypothetical protein